VEDRPLFADRHYSTVHIYTQTIHRTIQLTTEQHNQQQRNTINNRTIH